MVGLKVKHLVTFRGFVSVPVPLCYREVLGMNEVSDGKVTKVFSNPRTLERKKWRRISCRGLSVEEGLSQPQKWCESRADASLLFSMSHPRLFL